MNSLLANLLTNTAAVDTLRAGLPRAFEMAAVEASRVTLNKRTRLAQSTTGQEVGVLRERVILGYLISQLGETNVKLPAPGVSMVDASLAEQPLEIKTVTGSGLVTAKWTSDNESVDQLLEDFAFTSDMLWVRIWWDSDQDSVFYIPVEVLTEVAASPFSLRLSDISVTGPNSDSNVNPMWDPEAANSGNAGEMPAIPRCTPCGDSAAPFAPFRLRSMSMPPCPESSGRLAALFQDRV